MMKLTAKARRHKRDIRQGSRINCRLLPTSKGWLALAATEKGLLALVLPQESKEQAFQKLREQLSGELVMSPAPFKTGTSEAGASDLTDYFEGKRVSFNYPFDLEGATPFQRKVWETICTIPYGEVCTYSWVAETMGNPKASRAVGQALSANPIPILIPCHRVLRSDGTLGGFSSGLAWKKKLLQLEGIEKFT